MKKKLKQKIRKDIDNGNIVCARDFGFYANTKYGSNNEDRGKMNTAVNTERRSSHLRSKYCDFLDFQART